MGNTTYYVIAWVDQKRRERAPFPRTRECGTATSKQAAIRLAEQILPPDAHYLITTLSHRSPRPHPHSASPWPVPGYTLGGVATRHRPSLISPDTRWWGNVSRREPRPDIMKPISKVQPMPDILVRDVDPATLARIDAAAQRSGVSRSVLLRELLARYAADQDSGTLTDEQIASFGDSVRDLRDEETRAAAWQR